MSLNFNNFMFNYPIEVTYIMKTSKECKNSVSTKMTQRAFFDAEFEPGYSKKCLIRYVDSAGSD